MTSVSEEISSSVESDDLVFRALADRKRRLILDLLRLRPRTTGELCAALPEIDRCTVMLHISVLEKAELVVASRQGRTRINVLNLKPLILIQKRWLGSFTGSAVDLLNKL